MASHFERRRAARTLPPRARTPTPADPPPGTKPLRREGVASVRREQEPPRASKYAGQTAAMTTRPDPARLSDPAYDPAGENLDGGEEEGEEGAKPKPKPKPKPKRRASSKRSKLAWRLVQEGVEAEATREVVVGAAVRAKYRAAPKAVAREFTKYAGKWYDGTVTSVTDATEATPGFISLVFEDGAQEDEVLLHNVKVYAES
jgi:hypothetical protein